MRIAILTELFYPAVGGQAVRYQELGGYLVRQGHSVDVYTIRHEPGLAVEQVVDGIRVFRRPDSFGYIRSRWPGRRVSGILGFSWHVRGLLGAKASAYDLLLFNEWPIFHILFAPRRRPYRIVVDWCEIRNGWLMKQLQGAMARAGDAHVCVSEAVRDELIGRYDLRQDDCVVVQSGIHFGRYRPRQDGPRRGPRLLFMGRLVRHKRIDVVVSAFIRLLHIYPDATLCIVGDGPILSSLALEHEALVAAGKLAFTGFIRDEEKIVRLVESDVFVLASEREGFPRVVAEAMAAGLPVVTTDHPGNGTSSVVRQYGIGVVTSATPAAVAEGVDYIWRDRNTYHRCAENARQHAASLDWGQLSARLLAFGTT